MTEYSRILPANTDDPRFQDNRKEESAAEWTVKDAIVADFPDPIDSARLSMTSEYGVVAVIEIVLTAAVEVASGLISRLSQH